MNTLIGLGFVLIFAAIAVGYIFCMEWIQRDRIEGQIELMEREGYEVEYIILH